jgi:hypothetical protein
VNIYRTYYDREGCRVHVLPNDYMQGNTLRGERENHFRFRYLSLHHKFTMECLYIVVLHLVIEHILRVTTHLKFF